jgi:hypothetical protein
MKDEISQLQIAERYFLRTIEALQSDNKRMKERLRIVENQTRFNTSALDKVYSLDVIQNYAKYRKIREDYERNVDGS